jgi:hypothetical protein
VTRSGQNGLLQVELQDGWATGPYLTWDLHSEPVAEIKCGGLWWFQDAVVMHAPDGAVLWRRELPARCRGWQVGIGAAEVEGHKKFPRTIQGLSFVIGLEWTADAVAFADRTGVLVLARKDGAVLLDAPFETPIELADGLWFDGGSITIGDGTVPARGGKAFARCGGEWIYLNGLTLAAIDVGALRVTATARYDAATHRAPDRTPRVRATMRLGERRVDIEGITYMR